MGILARRRLAKYKPWLEQTPLINAAEVYQNGLTWYKYCTSYNVTLNKTI